MTRREQRAGMNIVEAAEGKIADFAEDLGRLLGTARAKAEGWLAQRSQVTQTLQEIRDTASHLLSQLTNESGVRRGRPSGAKSTGASVRRAARAANSGSAGPRKRRAMSAAGRAKISAAQKKRWAAVRRMKAGKGRKG